MVVLGCSNRQKYLVIVSSYSLCMLNSEDTREVFQFKGYFKLRLWVKFTVVMCISNNIIYYVATLLQLLV